MQNSYSLLDSGDGRKLERFGPYVIARPAAQAVWAPQLPDAVWQKADAFFSRKQENKWEFKDELPAHWRINVEDLVFKISQTDFGHLGIFPEQKPFWKMLKSVIAQAKASTHPNVEVLNLFAYSGGSTLAAASAGARVCHLDASKGMVAWARENAAFNELEKAPIRWIVDDVGKFLKREIQRGRRYDGIILDPPTFGRGSQGETFKIEEDIRDILGACRNLLSDAPLFVCFSCHTPGFTPIAMQHLLVQMMQGCGGSIDSGEMVLSGEPGVFALPSGTYARWLAHVNQ